MQYYIEPGTKKRFRSRLSVERHLAERQGYAAVTKGLTQKDQSTVSWICGTSFRDDAHIVENNASSKRSLKIVDC